MNMLDDVAAHTHTEREKEREREREKERERAREPADVLSSQWLLWNSIHRDDLLPGYSYKLSLWNPPLHRP